MTQHRIDPFDERPAPDTRQLAVAVILGALFVVLSLLVAVLPALAVVYLVVGFAVRDVVVVLALWAASATLSVASYLAISRTFARSLLGRRITDAVAATGPSEV